MNYICPNNFDHLNEVSWWKGTIFRPNCLLTQTKCVKPIKIGLLESFGWVGLIGLKF